MPECCSCSAELQRCKAELSLKQEEVNSLLRQLQWSQIGKPPTSGSSVPPAPMDPILTDYLPRTATNDGPFMPEACLEVRAQEVADIANGVAVPGVQLGLNLWQFAPMQPGETLQEHVQCHVLSGACPGPHLEESMVFKSNIGMAARKQQSLQEAARISAHTWATVATYRSEWQAALKNLLAGRYLPIVTRAVLFGDAEQGTESRGFKFVTWPAVVVDHTGQRHWGMVQQICPASQVFLNTWRLRDLLTVKHTPTSLTVVAVADGAIMWQNAASLATFADDGPGRAKTGLDPPLTLLHKQHLALLGARCPLPPIIVRMCGGKGGAGFCGSAPAGAATGVHGRFNTDAKHGDGAPAAAHDAAVPSSRCSYSRQTSTGLRNFMNFIFESNKAELEQMKTSTQGGEVFRTQIEVVHPRLRSLMGLREGKEVHHDVQVSFTRDPVTLHQVYIVAQIDVTAAVLAKRQVVEAKAQLEEEKVRTEVLLHRQYELVECLGWVSEVGRSAAGDQRAAELIDNVRRQIVGSRAADGDGEQIELLYLLGEGSYGKVFKGLWRDRSVAVKSTVLPITMNGNEKKERMAIMEAAISSSLSHPNIVQTYTYSLKPVRGSSTPSLSGRISGTGVGAGVPPLGPHRAVSDQLPASGGRAAVSAFEVQIVQELCDRGTLRDALAQGAFLLACGAVNYSAVLDVAVEVSRGMQHLHSCNILHSDLKAANVLLQSNPAVPKGVTAKIADFGLSVQMVTAETHVSGLFQGTVTHMAPETLMCGLQSNAADMYAFSITLWELYTGLRPYPNLPRAHLGYQVTREHCRPVFPPGTPRDYQALAELCWDEKPMARPSFAEVLEVLVALRESEGGVTPPLRDGVRGGTHAPPGTLGSWQAGSSNDVKADGTAYALLVSSSAGTVGSHGSTKGDADVTYEPWTAAPPVLPPVDDTLQLLDMDNSCLVIGTTSSTSY